MAKKIFYKLEEEFVSNDCVNIYLLSNHRYFQFFCYGFALVPNVGARICASIFFRTHILLTLLLVFNIIMILKNLKIKRLATNQ